eukprot:scaffold40814_cov63-Phaeocystis_antarctica.AAC.2
MAVARATRHYREPFTGLRTIGKAGVAVNSAEAAAPPRKARRPKFMPSSPARAWAAIDCPGAVRHTGVVGEKPSASVESIPLSGESAWHFVKCQEVLKEVLRTPTRRVFYYSQ